jgi:hypothetical protein
VPMYQSGQHASRTPLEQSAAATFIRSGETGPRRRPPTAIVGNSADHPNLEGSTWPCQIKWSGHCRRTSTRNTSRTLCCRSCAAANASGNGRRCP